MVDTFQDMSAKGFGASCVFPQYIYIQFIHTHSIYIMLVYISEDDYKNGRQNAERKYGKVFFKL